MKTPINNDTKKNAQPDGLSRLSLALLYLALGIALVMSPPPLKVAGSAPTPVQAAPVDAGAVLQASANALAAASTIRADFEEIDSYPTPYKDLAQRGTVLLDRSGRLRIDIKRFRRINTSDPWAPSGNDAISVSDGHVYTYAFLHPHSTQVRQEASTPAALRAALRPVAPLARFFAAGGAAAATPYWQQESALPSEIWEGVSYQVIQYTTADGDRGPSQVKAYVGPDGLVLRLIAQRSTDGGIETREWTLRNIHLGETVTDSDFAYTAPPDSTALSGGPHEPLLAAGTEAPDFMVHDANGNAVKLSDFRGKTVVLDFWATWCWPCNQSLPHTDDVVRETGSQGSVVALAVAIWDSHDGFVKWLASHSYPNIHFAIDPSPQGQDVASSLYHVGTTPTAYVIDPSGKIVKAIEGYTGPSPELAAAIQSAEASKTAER